jgi:hypothetical protein
MQNMLKLLKDCWTPLVVMFIYILLINSFFGNVQVTIHADGVGYYDYLPSIFLRKDINRKDKPVADFPELYQGRVAEYTDYKGLKINKYACGTALLMAPFFAYACATADLRDTAEPNQVGYQPAFQKAIFYAALTYLFLSLLLLGKTLELYGVRKWVSILMQFLMGLGTAVTHYANADASYSHIYSLFAISAFIYCAVAYFRSHQPRHLVLMLMLLGLVVILRQVNVLVLLFLPFLAGGWAAFKNGLVTMISQTRWLVLGLLLFGAVFSIQSLLWFLQVGEWLLYSYGEERFYFDLPEPFNILFSYEKGLFVYTPVLFIALSGLVWLFCRRRSFEAITWWGAFVVLTYVLSSWWAWSYGSSYGLRAYIEFYPLFFIPLALLLDQMRSNAKYLLVVAALLCIPLNVIQTYQYKYCILHWEHMNKQRYWDVFLRTDERFKGIFFKPKLDKEKLQVVKMFEIGTVRDGAGKEVKLLNVEGDSLPDMSKVKMARLHVNSDYQPTYDSKFVLSIETMDNAQIYHWSERPLLHFQEQGLGKWQQGFWNFPLNKPMPSTATVRLKLFLYPVNLISPVKDVKLELWGIK